MNSEARKIAGKLFCRIRGSRGLFDAWHRGHHFIIERVDKGHYDIEVHDARGCFAVNTVEALPDMQAAIKFALQGAQLD